MAVYVDDMQLPADVGNNGRAVRGRWSHLFADTPAELEDFARQLGLSPRWIQHQREPGEHYDVTEGKRQQALKLGAQPVTWREAGLMLTGRREEARRSAEERDAGKPKRHRWPSYQPGECRNGDRCLDCGLALADAKRGSEPCRGAKTAQEAPEAEGARQDGPALAESPATAALRTLATELDRQAGVRFRAGDHQGALDLLNAARETYPDMAAVLTEHTGRVLAAATEAQAVPPVPGAGKPVREGYCPSCGAAELASGRTACQACRAVEAYRSGPQRAAGYPDLSHGNPGHMCVLPGAGQAEREAEAGS
jgi:hypothetical protein